MLSIFICEDNQVHKEQITKCVESCIIINNLDMRIVLSTDNPDEIMDYIKNNSVSGLYFLDVDLNHDIDGLELAKCIRDYDPRGFIVFITTHDEALPLIFQYKVEALDFILKEEFFDIQNKVYECILNAQKKYAAKANELQRNFSFKILDKIMTVEYSKILYFETSTNATHKVFVHTTDGIYEFYGVLSNLKKMLDESFFRCHNSYIINLRQELRLELNEKRVYFNQGSSCPVSSRKIKVLIELLQSFR